MPSKDGWIMIVTMLIGLYIFAAGIVQTIEWIKEVIA